MFDVNQGYPALFCLSFLASTIVPLGSEWLLIAMILKGFDPLTTVAVATGGNTIGAFTTYALGRYGSAFVMEKILGISRKSRKKAETLYARYGMWSLLFSWVPVVGDPLCLAGGVLQVRFAPYAILVTLGKLARYAAICWVTLKLSLL